MYPVILGVSNSIFLYTIPFFIVLSLGAYILRPQSYSKGLAVIDADGVHFWTVSELQQIETTLKKIRRNRRPVGWYCQRRGMFIPTINLAWQQMAVRCTPIAFEVFLIDTVWRSKGDQYARHRLLKSPYRQQIERIQTEQPCITY